MCRADADERPAPYPSRMRSAATTLPGQADSVPAARRFVESALEQWGEPERAWTLALLVSELATNATLHARTPFRLTLSRSADGVLRVEVRDGSLRAPRQRAYAESSTTGRGLRMVEMLASAWGVDVHPDGKTVWAQLSASGSGDDDALLDAFDDDDGAPAAPRRSGPAGRRPAGSTLRAA